MMRRPIAVLVIGLFLGPLAFLAVDAQPATACVNCVSRGPAPRGPGQPPSPDVHVRTGRWYYRRGLYGELLLCWEMRNTRNGAITEECGPVFADYRLWGGLG